MDDPFFFLKKSKNLAEAYAYGFGYAIEMVGAFLHGEIPQDKLREEYTELRRVVSAEASRIMAENANVRADVLAQAADLVVTNDPQIANDLKVNDPTRLTLDFRHNITGQ